MSDRISFLGEEGEFKVLMHNGRYVDNYNLSEGICSTDVPCLYNKNMTMTSLFKEHQPLVNSGLIPASYVENMMQCELVAVKLTIIC